MSAAARAADGEARRRAQTEFGTPLALEAGAGTGKTTVLVGRILAWCLGPGWDRIEVEAASDAARATRVLDGVVAVTFTEAAAAEMAERVARALHQVRAGETPGDFCTDAWPDDREVCRRRAAALLGELDRLQVSTIHAFCRRLLSEAPIEAGLHPHFEIDARGLARGRVAREVVIERIEADSAADDGDLLLLVQRGFGAPELADSLALMLERSIASGALSDPLAPERVAEFGARLEDALAGFERAVAGGRDALPAQSRAADLCEAVARVRALWNAELLGEDRRRLEPIRAVGIGWPKLADWQKGKFGARERDAFEASCPSVAAAAAALEPLLRYLRDTDFELLAAFHRVIPPLLAEAETRLAAAGQETFQGLLERTRDLLRREATVAARQRHRIRQLMVDEFQDTDRVQCEILGLLATGAERPGLFLVGDPKQSIYGWRNADLAAYQEFVAASGAEVLRLQVNHRSVPGILAEVERAIAPVMLPAPGLQPEFAALLAGESRIGAEGAAGVDAVEYWISCGLADGAPVELRSDEATRVEAAALARDLLRARAERGAAWRDSAVLLGSRGGMDAYLDALRDAGIPYVTDRDLSYYRRREVRDAVALVRLVLDPEDAIARVATLRSSWVGVPDAAWMPLWRRNFGRLLRDAMLGAEADLEPLRTACREAAAEVRADPAAARIPGLEALGAWESLLLHAVEVLVALRRSLESESFDRFVERVRTLSLLEVCEAARYQGRHRAENLERLFRELGEWLEASGGDLSEVSRELRRVEREDRVDDEGRVADPAEDAVRIMTIHAAKGLAFEHVYVPQLHRRRSEIPPAWHGGRVGPHLEFRLRMAGRTVATLAYDRVAARDRAVRDAEAVRLLYVAMTRARRRLVLAGHLAPEGSTGVHASLLQRARGEALAAAWSRAGTFRDGDGVRWAFPAADDGAAPVAAPVEERSDGSGGRERSRELEARRSEAARRAARRFGAPVTAHASERREARTDEAAPAAAATEAGRIAAAVGTAVHRLLELYDWEAESGREWARRREQLRGELRRNLGAGAFPGAVARAERLLDALVDGPLWPRLGALAPHVVGRELPVLLGPAGHEAGDGDPTDYLSGVIDLLYRDPRDGAWVVADFKTDRIADVDGLDERARRYREQGAAYLRAVREGLGQAGEAPPALRFELWFLDASRVVPVDCGA